MTAAWATRLRRARRGAWYLAAASLVLVAVGALLLAQLALPWVERNPRTVEHWLTERAGRPVAFETLQVDWTRRGPLLQVTGLRIGEPASAVPIDRAEIQVAPYTGLLPGRSLTELRLHGLALSLLRDDDGRWHVRGLPGDARPDADPFAALEGLGELQVVGARLSVDAPALSLHHALPRVDLRLQVDRRRVRAAAQAWLEDAAAPLDLRLDLVREAGDGRVYLDLPQADLRPWSPLLAPAGLTIDVGEGRAAVWLDLEARRVASVTAELALEALALRAEDGSAAPRVGIDAVQARLHWAQGDGDWRLDAPRLRLVHDGAEQTLDGLTVAGGRRWAVRAERIDVAPLLALAPLARALPPSLRDWLHAASPRAVLHDVEFAALRDGPLRVSARVEAFGFDPVDDRPGLHGLSGEVSGDADAVVFQPDPATTAVFDWPVGFGVPHPLRLDGAIVAWRDGGDWHVDTPALRLVGDGYAADARGGIWFQADDSRPRLDLAVRVDTARVPVAKKFWVRHEMPVAARAWLDMALVAGDVRDGRAIVAGDLDDWPFDAREGQDVRGVFAAEARIEAGTIRFQDDWPPMTRLSARVRFVNDGFALDDAVGELAGVAVRDVEAGMRHYAGSPVTVQAGASTDAAQLLTLLRRSPFQAEHADTLDALDVRGPAQVRLALEVPADAPVRLDGRVALDGVTMRESRFDLAFDDVRGEARFDQAGFGAGALAVRQNGQPGTLALRAGDGHVRDPAHAFEGLLDIRLAAADLLARAPDLAWLRPHVDGTAPWQVQVSIPDAPPAGAPAARLLLRSDLVGTALRLPAPLDKPARTPLRTTIEAPVPFDAGDIAVGFGDRLAVRARSRGDATGIRVEFGTGRVHAAPPPVGLAIAGRTPVVDLVDWLGLLGGGGDGDGLALQALDLTTADLRLPGAPLGQTRLTGRREAGGTALRLDGARVAGDVHLPDAGGARITAALQRLHLPAPAPKTQAAGPAPVTPPPAAADADTLDPASVPPLQLAIDDLRIGALPLGVLTARTRPVPAGLVLELLSLRAPQHRVDATGRWTGRGAAARTAVEIDVDSDDFGRLLTGLGFAGSIVGGQGRVDFDTAWPGAPNAFDVAALEGALQLTVRDGQLVEVDPGAGRVLGLLSLTELPRRLTLDFRDFFNRGFGFSEIVGDIRFGGGQARSEGVTIDGPAAEIHIRGRADLRARTHDQTIEVLPKTGNLLPAVGALTAGPVGAALGAVANAVLRKPLGEIGARHYHVSGPWQDPKVEVVERRDAAQDGAAARPPAPD